MTDVSSPEMKAVCIHSFGDASGLALESVPKPDGSANDILIKVKAAGVTTQDVDIRTGKSEAEQNLPLTPGCDIAGIVEAVGDSVTKFKPGDQIYSYIGAFGGYAEYVAIPESYAALKPERLSFNEAAAIPSLVLQATQIVFEQAQIVPSDRILVHDGASGAGLFVIQLAAMTRAHVICTATAKTSGYLKTLGANEVIDSIEASVTGGIRDIDVIIDMSGEDSSDLDLQMLHPQGKIVRAIRRSDGGILPNGFLLKEIASLIDAGRLSPRVAATFKLEDAAKAHQLLELNVTRGQIVLEI